jgi:hypothetical protein
VRSDTAGLLNQEHGGQRSTRSKKQAVKKQMVNTQVVTNRWSLTGGH